MYLSTYRTAELQLLSVRLRRLRIGRTLSQKELGNRCNLSCRYISDIKCGHRGIRLANLYRLSCRLDMTLSSLLDFGSATDSSMLLDNKALNHQHISLISAASVAHRSEYRLRLGRIIAMLQQSQLLSQNNFCLMLGLGQTYLVAIENGRINIGFDNLCKIASGLGITVSEFTDIDDFER